MSLFVGQEMAHGAASDWARAPPARRSREQSDRLSRRSSSPYRLGRDRPPPGSDLRLGHGRAGLATVIPVQGSPARGLVRLSDVKLAEALDDRASFRRFCGFAAEEPTPERTAFVRFRRALLARDLDRVLFAAVTDQLDAQGVTVKTGTLVDATLIASASIKSDDEARWAGHRRKKPVHGYKAHVATDEAGGLVRTVEITTANVHDGIMLEAVLPSDPGEVYADSAYAADRFTNVIRARGGVPRVVHTHTWGGPAALARLEAWNAEVRAVRCRIEKVFGTWKRSYGLRRMRWL